MNKIKNIVCYSVGILLSILTFAWYALDSMTAKMGSISSGISVYDTLAEDTTGSARTSMVFAIIALVFAVLLAIACVLGILNELGKIKGNWAFWVVLGVAILFLVASLVAMACMASYCGEANDLIGTNAYSCGAGLILPFVFSIIALAATCLTKLNLKK